MGGLLMTKERVRDLTDIMARVLHYQDRGEPSWQEMDYAGTKREYDELPKEIIDRYRNDAKFHAQVQRAVSMVLELDRSAVEPGAAHPTVMVAGPITFTCTLCGTRDQPQPCNHVKLAY
jgi:hypothetical protein